MSEGDRELLAAWGAGDNDAGNALIRRHFRCVYLFFSTKLDVGIEDLVQRTFLGLLEGRSRIADAEKFRPYLLGVARYTLIDHLKKKVRDTTDVLESMIPGVAATPTALIADGQQQRLLLRALRRLPLELQILLGLHYWDGLKVDEIAEITEAPAGTVKYRMHRARQLLREAVEALAETPEQATQTIGGFATWLGGLRADPED